MTNSAASNLGRVRETGRKTLHNRRFGLLLGALLWTGTAGAQAELEVDGKPPEQPAATVPSQPAEAPGAEGVSASSALRNGEASKVAPLDLCAHRPNAAADSYQRQRVLLFNPSVDARASAVEYEINEKGQTIPGAEYHVLESIHAGEMARIIVATQFPLSRFYLVATPRELQGSLPHDRVLTLAEVEAAASHDDFISYSAACSDWLAVPFVATTPAHWQKVTRERTVFVNGKAQKIKYLAWSLDAGFTLRLAVFRREGAGFRFATEIHADNGGLTGLAAALAENESAPRAREEYVSTWPDASCALGKPSDGSAGSVGSCGGVTPRFSPILADTRLVAAAYCRDVDDAVASGGAAMIAVARCTAASKAEALVRLAQREAKRFRPWAEFARLMAVAGENSSDAIPLGAEDGVRRGDVYVAESDRDNGAGRSLGYARVVRLGRGGAAGVGSPSLLKFKRGEAPAGTRMTEYALLGVRFGVRPGVLVLAAKGELSTTLAYGGEASVGYDLTRHVPWFDEFWGRLNVGYFKGSGQEGLLAVDAGLEAVNILGSGFASVLGTGLSGMMASVERRDTMGRALSFSGGNFGVFGRAGLEYSFGPDWSADVAAELRSGFRSATLDSEVTTQKLNGGLMVGALALLSVAHSF